MEWIKNIFKQNSKSKQEYTECRGDIKRLKSVNTIAHWNEGGKCRFVSEIQEPQLYSKLLSGIQNNQ